jgi:heptosyltransferase-2
MTAAEPDRILVRRPTWIGDVVMATPALRAIKERYPDAALTAVARPPASLLLEGHPRVDEVLTLEAREERGLRGALRLARRLRQRRFDMAILLANSFTSALPCFLARIPIRAGYRGDLRGPLLTHAAQAECHDGVRVPVPMPVYYQRVLDLLEIPSRGPAYELGSRPGIAAQVEDRLRRLGVRGDAPIVGLSPGARFGESKLWPAESFAACARELSERGFTPLLLGAAAERDLLRRIADLSEGRAFDSGADPFGIEELPGLLPRLLALITTDSGPRHIATWAGLPVVVVMGPTHPGWTHWNLDRTEIVRKDVPCGPCHLKVCPTDHRCLRSITPEEVLAALERVCPLVRRGA